VYPFPLCVLARSTPGGLGWQTFLSNRSVWLRTPVLYRSPPLDPAWLQHEHEGDLLVPKAARDPIVRRQVYATQCRERNLAMISQGQETNRLAQGIETEDTYAPQH
jgi:hypothetical protein